MAYMAYSFNSCAGVGCENKNLMEMIDRKDYMNELKKRLKAVGISRKDLAEKIGVRYMTLSGYLNEFVPMPDHIRQEIDEILREVEE